MAASNRPATDRPASESVGSESPSADRGVVRESIEDLLQRLRPRLKQILARYRVPAHDAEDLVQESLVSTLQKWSEIQDPEAWLLVTLRNRCVVYWRKKHTNLYNSVDAVILELLSEPEAAPQEKAEVRWDLDNLIEGLPPRCRRLLRLRYRLGLDSGEVAVQMGYHPSSVRKVARRCMAALTERMFLRGYTKRPIETDPSDSSESD